MKRSAATKSAERDVLDHYREWADSMAYCVVTQYVFGVDWVHIRNLEDHDGELIRVPTGMGRKPEPWKCLPLHRRLHRVQENNPLFFVELGLANPLREAAELFAIWRDQRDASQWAARIAAIHDAIDQEKALDMWARAA